MCRSFFALLIAFSAIAGCTTDQTSGAGGGTTGGATDDAGDAPTEAGTDSEPGVDTGGDAVTDAPVADAPQEADTVGSDGGADAAYDGSGSDGPSLPVDGTLPDSAGFDGTVPAPDATDALAAEASGNGDGGADSATDAPVQGDAAEDGGAIVLDPAPCGGGFTNGAILDVGNAVGLESASATQTLILTDDASQPNSGRGTGPGHWVLWNRASRSRIASGSSYTPSSPSRSPYMDLYGIRVTDSVFFVEVMPGVIELHDSHTGALRATVSGGTGAYGLAPDASYLWAATTTAICAWSVTDGTQLFCKSGNYFPRAYGASPVFAAPGELRVAGGPAGNVIETLAVPSGTSTTSPTYQALFTVWFGDGETFVTSAGSYTFIYPRSATSPKATFQMVLGAVYGWGNYLVLGTGPTLVYSITGPSTLTPVVANVYGNMTASGGSLAITGSPTGTVSETQIDLTTTPPTTTTASVPLPSYATPYSVGIVPGPGGGAIASTGSGIVFDLSIPSSPVRYGCGKIRSLAGAGDGSWAAATDVGVILGSANAGGSVRGVLLDVANELQFSAAGDVLVVDSGNVDTLSMPSGRLIHRFAPGGEWHIASGGTTIGFASSVKAFTTDLMNGPPSWMATPTVLGENALIMGLSPNGKGVAVRDNYAVDVFVNGALSSIVSMASASVAPVAWLDDSRLLVSDHAGPMLLAMRLVDVMGHVLSSPPLPDLFSVIPLAGNRVYNGFAIYDLGTGMPVWTSAHPKATLGAIAGASAVSVDGPGLFAETY
jgi:hypothetical protein